MRNGDILGSDRAIGWVGAGLLRLFVGDKYLGEPAPTGPIIAINSNQNR